jgi:hypothetical protein
MDINERHLDSSGSPGEPIRSASAWRPRGRRSRAGWLTVLVLGLALLSAGCGSSSSGAGSSSSNRTPTTATTPAARAKFVGHAGLAFGAFHRYVYHAFKTGSLGSRAQHNAAVVKAEAAVTAAAREVMLAKQAATGSTALRKLFAPLAALEPTLRGLATRLSHGHLTAADIKSANGQIAGVEQIGSAAGVRIFERAPALKQ